ncbi:hypothetical protein BC826DRAFT_1084073 [Russula brevipes]|nr:hypothetical protein BC826DRAFT_1084073 [Russula brevipes]
MYTPIDAVTSQGIDMQFGTNVLGHFYLTKLLLPILTATAKKSPAGTVRVVNVSSIGHYLGAPEGIRWSTLNPEMIRSRRARNWHDQGNILFSNELARRYGGEGVVSISLHPGTIDTDLSRYASSLVQRAGRLVTYSVSYGAITSLYAGTSPAACDLNGKYLTAWARVTLPNKKVLNPELETKLWEWCEEKVKDI